MICVTVIRFLESGSRIFRNSDNANVSSLLHGVIVIHELSLFHWTNSAQPVVGSSHGSSVDWIKFVLETILSVYNVKFCVKNKKYEYFLS